MTTLTVEITDSLQELLDRELAAGQAKNQSALVQTLLEAAIQARWKERIEDKIDEALDAIDRGEVVVHKKGDCGRMGREYLKEKRAREAKS